MPSSNTAVYSEETVPLKDMAYNKKNQSHSTNTYERKQPWNQQRNITITEIQEMKKTQKTF